MPYCSLEEAWAPVNYPKSDVYGKEGNSIYPEQCSEEPKLVQKSFSRTNERLAKHSGPVNRLPDYKNQVVKYNSENKQRYMAEPDSNNDDTPITSYDRNFFEKNDKSNVPIHTITMKKPKVEAGRIAEKSKKKKDMDSIDKIIAEVEDSSVNESDNEEPFDVNSTYKDLSKEHDDKNEIIKHLIGQNEKLKTMIKKMEKKPTTSGVFNIWDFIIVLLLGVIMLIILDYISRIVIKKSMN